MASPNEQRDYRPFIQECAKRGIGKTKAYELANADLLDTFLIGSKRFVYLDSLLTLPQRLADAANDTKVSCPLPGTHRRPRRQTPKD